jgi:3-hydroxyisobutyrate dehydrogenase
MAANLIRAGFPLTVYDLIPERLAPMAKSGAVVASSVLEVAEGSDIVAIAVVNDRQVREVMLGADEKGGVLSAAKAGAIVVIHSTVSPELCRQMESRAALRGVRVLDAPVSGAARAATTGKLTLLVGGSKEDLETCRELFAVIGDHIFHLGDVGMGQVAKLCNNVMFTVNLRTALEALRMAAATGIGEDQLLEIAAVSTGNSWALEHIKDMQRLMLSGQQSMSAWLIGNKDLALAVQTAQSAGVDVPISKFLSSMDNVVIGDKARQGL